MSDAYLNMRRINFSPKHLPLLNSLNEPTLRTLDSGKGGEVKGQTTLSSFTYTNPEMRSSEKTTNADSPLADFLENQDEKFL